MTLDFFRIRRGLELDESITILQGGSPPGATSDTDDANPGSLFLSTTAGKQFIKNTSGAGTDKWTAIASEEFVTNSLADISWREPVEVVDTTSVVLPTETPGNPITVDGESISDGERVLFTNLSSDNNIYSYDQTNGVFVEDTTTETDGDAVYVQRGTYAKRRFFFNGTSWDTNDSILENVAIVQTDPGHGQFSSIKDAVDFAITQSPGSTNPWVIFVNPGIYSEDAITMPSHTSIVGTAPSSVFIEPTDPDDDLFLFAASTSSRLQDLTIRNVTGVGAAGIKITNAASPAIFDTVLITNCYYHLNVEGNLSEIRSLFIKSSFTSGADTREFIHIESSGSLTTEVRLFTTNFQEISGASFVRGMYISGDGAHLITNGSILESATGTGDGIHMNDGGKLSSYASSSIIGFDRNIFVENVGAAPVLETVTVTSIDGVTNDLLIDHPGTTGFFGGVADPDKVSVHDDAAVSLLFNHTNGDKGVSIIGDLFIGDTNSEKTNVTDLIQETTPTGVITGGELSKTATALEISVNEGFGYTENTVIEKNKRVEWTTTVLTLPDDANNWIYVTSAGTVTFSPTFPDFLHNIVLGRVRTEVGDVDFIAKIPLNSEHAATQLDLMLREAFGAVYVSGSIVTASPGSPTTREIDVSSGAYYFSKLKFTPTGGASIDFDPHFHSSGSFTEGPSTTVVDNTQFDNGTDLAALSSGFYTKHTFWVAGDDTEEEYVLIYGQAEYETLVEAQQADVPLPPTSFTDVVVPIAAIIVQEGNNSIVEIGDIRPRLGFQAPSVTASSNHGNLLGLSDDDHPQYLLVNGTREMIGNLDLGSNDIIDVGTVDGVDVSSHASRHLPGGADALTTASAVDLTPSSISAEGTANSFARSDHTHALLGLQSALTWEDEDVIIGGSPLFTTINFTGDAVTVTDAGSGQLDVTISAQNLFETFTVGGSPEVVLTADSANTNVRFVAGTGIKLLGTGSPHTITVDFAGFKITEIFADQFLFPNTADWAVGNPAAFTTDPGNDHVSLRAFDDTTEEGVGFDLWVPAGATDITFEFVSRPITDPGADVTIGLTLYLWEMPENGVDTPGWNVGTTLGDVTVGDITGGGYFYGSQTHALGDVGLTAGLHYITEITRVNPQAGTELSGDWALRAMRISFS